MNKKYNNNSGWQKGLKTKPPLKIPQLSNCKNCSKKLTGEFCSACGFPNTLKRIDKNYIAEEISSIINFDRGLFYTVKELFVRPGDTVKTFILEDRKRLVKPILFLIICSIIYNLSQHFFSFEAGYLKFDVNNPNDLVIGKMYNWLSNNYGYANILIAIPITAWTKIIFKKYNYNYYEIYVLLCFVLGNSILAYALLGILESVVGFPLIQIGFFFGTIYFSWAVGQFYDRKKKLNYLKGFFSYILGIITSIIIFALTAISIQELIK